MKFNIPNIRKMWIETLGTNKDLLDFGILKKERNIHFEQNKNNKVNRYLKHQFKRLENSVKRDQLNNSKFNNISLLLIQRSKSFRMLALSNVRPNWYKDITWSSVTNTLHRLNGICHRPRDYYRFKRVPIDKDDGTKRFLTVPDLEIRLYLWIWNCVLHFFYKDKLNKNQFGHRKGIGLVNAWKTLADNIHKYPYLLEFDLKKFHDTIDHKFLSKALFNTGLEIPMIRKLINLQSPYMREDPDPSDQGMRKPEISLFSEMFGIEEEPNTLKRWNVLTGVPQGANTSAILGMICLEYLKVYEIPDSIYIGYADDGVILSKSKKCLDELRERLNTVESGIQLKIEKTGWVRRSNKWIKPLKFLGCEWSPKGFYSNTRSGKRKFWEWGDLENTRKVIEIARPMKDFYHNRIKSLKLSGSNEYAGLLFSKLFGSETDKKADRELKCIKGSWLDKTNRFCKIENASSYAYLFLRLNWREEWSVKQPLKFKGKFDHSVKTDLPGLIPHPLLNERNLAQLDNTNLYAPKFAQPTPFFPVKWPESPTKGLSSTKWESNFLNF